MTNKNDNKTQRGFTIIEMMVAVSVFTVVVMSGLGALLNANFVYQKTQNMRSIIDGMSFILEDMSRNLRTGYHYRCYNGELFNAQTEELNTPRSCVNGSMLVFEEVSGRTPIIPPSNTDPNATDQWIYLMGTYSNKSGIFKSSNGGIDWVQLTPEEVDIDFSTSGFSVLGAESPEDGGDQQQPFVTIRLNGNINFKGVNTPFSLQTSVSQRGLDR